MSRPASSARRWPDLLIGLLVALLLVGFGLLLFRPEGRPVATTSAAPTEPGNTPATIPAAPGTSTAETAPPATAVTPAPDVTGTPTPDAATETTPAETAPTTDGSAAPDAAEPPTIAAAPEITQAPQSSPTQSSSTPDTATPTQEPGTAPETSAQPAAPDENAATTAPPRSGGAVATSERRTPLRSDYRITLGTFTSEQTARARTAGVSGLGYTVYPIDLGSQVVAQVGPFADEASARQALADIQRAYPGALLYPPRNRSLSSGTTSGAASSSTGSTSSAPSGPTYLQVGAFDRVESAQRLVGQLRDLGYSPTVNAPEGRKVSVLVGPFTGDALTRTEQRLSSNGLDHFRVQ
ncbi:SPOR domain-containing protein [Deinococcus koreensis]|uniref:SPOR domain-containing protein n=1 Tax=Deinococcus koreensis TaxID=2054903 RepID=A0A2K3V0T1_9DEIO|nr:SPOR domain-containing protein [Deinococcus koreensis]PNY82390.1 hypothetical protein CVO96_14425 [Deinococcus koreensis]